MDQIYRIPVIQSRMRQSISIGLLSSAESKPSVNPLVQLKTKSDRSKKSEASSSKKSALDEIMIEEARRKKKRNDYWLTPGIVVKVVTKSAGDQYFKKKGVVKVSRKGLFIFINISIDTGSPVVFRKR